MSYKDTIRLPRTGFSMKGGLIKKEPEMLLAWENEKLEEKIKETRKNSKRYILHDGPPYANGHVHLGTALNKILKDFVVKSHTMMGYYSPYVPGWDCHGMPIEHRITSSEGASELSRDQIRIECRKYADEYFRIQREEFKRLGIFGDWENPYLTMDPAYEAGIIRAFGKLVEEGYIYEGLRPIHWCTSCKTALAEAEVEYDDHRSPSIYVAFRIRDPEKWKERGLPPDVEVVIWTTTPWTIPANMAVALNPGEEYVLVESDGRKLLVARRLTESFLKDSGLSGNIIPELKFSGKELDGLVLEHPLFNDRNSLVIVAEHVTMEDGTGCVHTAPGHGAEDFQVAKNYGIEIFCPVDEEGYFTEEARNYRGKHVFKANAEITENMKASGRLLAAKDVVHSYPHCWRCKNPLIFRATRQFFLNLEHRNLKSRVLDMVEEIGWHPDWGHERMRNMMAVRPDWCLSRQRSWGVALPVFRCLDCEKPLMDPELIRSIADLVEKEGSDAWFRLTPEVAFGLAGKESRCSFCGSDRLTRIDDILDVWFDASVSHYNVLNENYGLERPSSVYLEATDQHRGWFGGSLITSVALGHSRPADHIITHGLIQDKQGKKMSKSLGNVISPLEIVDRSGADVLRLWFASVDYTADFRADLNQLEDAKEAYRKLRNTLRFILGNLKEEKEEDLSPDRLTGLDRYIYLRFREIFSFCVEEYRKFQFHRMYRELRNFAIIDLSGLYLDVRKDRLYCDLPDSFKRVQTQQVLSFLAVGLIKLLAPLIPFTSEEAWKFLPERLRESNSVHLSTFPDFVNSDSEKEELNAWKSALQLRSALMKKLEEARTDDKIGGSLEAEVCFNAPEELVENVYGEDWADFLIVSRAFVSQGEEPSINVFRAEGAKCQRCWKRLPEVGKQEIADDVCERCGTVLEKLNWINENENNR